MNYAKFQIFTLNMDKHETTALTMFSMHSPMSKTFQGLFPYLRLSLCWSGNSPESNALVIRIAPNRFVLPPFVPRTPPQALHLKLRGVTKSKHLTKFANTKTPKLLDKTLHLNFLWSRYQPRWICNLWDSVAPTLPDSKQSRKNLINSNFPRVTAGSSSTSNSGPNQQMHLKVEEPDLKNNWKMMCFCFAKMRSSWDMELQVSPAAPSWQ